MYYLLQVDENVSNAAEPLKDDWWWLIYLYGMVIKFALITLTNDK